MSRGDRVSFADDWHDGGFTQYGAKNLKVEDVQVVRLQ